MTESFLKQESPRDYLNKNSKVLNRENTKQCGETGGITSTPHCSLGGKAFITVKSGIFFQSCSHLGQLMPPLVWLSVPSLQKLLDIHEVQASNCKWKFLSSLTLSILKYFAS